MNESTTSNELVVFELSSSSQCSNCKMELFPGNIVKLETRNDEKLAFCRECAKLDHLEILCRGNAKVTRLAGKYSSIKYVILRWSKTRKRYERQGILVEAGALDRVESELGNKL